MAQFIGFMFGLFLIAAMLFGVVVIACLVIELVLAVMGRL